MSTFNTDRMKDMRTSIIKKITRAAIIVQLIVMASSCKDYLNIDDYFDDEFNIDEVFNNVRYMEAYMRGAAGMFPAESNTIRLGYTPGPMATDEAINGLTGGGSNNVYYGMDFASGRITPDRFGDSNPDRNRWENYYQIIRKCNLTLGNPGRPQDMPSDHRIRIEGYPRFIRAYAYDNI